MMNGLKLERHDDHLYNSIALKDCQIKGRPVLMSMVPLGGSRTAASDLNASDREEHSEPGNPIAWKDCQIKGTVNLVPLGGSRGRQKRSTKFERARSGGTSRTPNSNAGHGTTKDAD
jgi:hypothetical protein